MTKLQNFVEKTNDQFEFISVDQFSNLTGLSKSYVYHLTSKGKLKHYKPFGKKIFFKLSDVHDLFERNSISSSDEIEQDAINYVFNPKK